MISNGLSELAIASSAGRTIASANTPVSGLSLANIHTQVDEQKRLPKWEVGFGAAGALLNDYPGSSQQHYLWVPVPYVVYRGDILRSDSNGIVRGVFLNSTEFDVDASLAGALPVNSEQDQARQGMPDLQWMGEIGPRVLVHLYHDANTAVDFSIPVRWVVSTDLTRVYDRGFDFNPELLWWQRARFDRHGKILTYFGALWGTSQLTRYFYGVSPQYATATRPTYSAKAGYMYDDLGISYRHSPSSGSRLLYFIGFDESFYAGSSNRRSPLMRSIQNQSMFVGFIYDFYRSREKASSRAVIQ